VQSRTRVKVCGITQPSVAVAIAKTGVDSIGLVFYDKSPRHVTIDQAVAICNALPPFITTVGLFVNPTPEFLHQVCEQVPLDVVQFHGDENPEYCRQHSPRPWFKALAMTPELDVTLTAKEYMRAGSQGILLDAYVQGARGGTGKTFDWARVPQSDGVPYILAGGLQPENVAEAIAQTQPWAVDVSSGVETAPGIKCPQAVSRFVAQTLKGAQGV